ncbi:synaptonemal complex protein 2 [Conger conger]|uniref:synaptonemal complex protein 2 n=1 Tax=Conger conger TaxID=82655 RepID=UPI002A5A2B98|nr:synaptonemal complex protein 2 [Conger conger]
MDQLLDPKRINPVLAEEKVEKPVKTNQQGEKPVTANRQMEKPAVTNKQGKKPVTANKQMEKPVVANKQGKKPVTANEQDKKLVLVEDQAGGQKESWSARLTDFPPSPPPIERMRSAGEFEALSASPISCFCSPDTPPLPLEVAPPFTGIQASAFYRSERGSSKGKTLSAPSVAHRAQAVPTPILSQHQQNVSPPLLTSTALEPSVPNSPLLEDSLGLLAESLGLPACLESFNSSSSPRSITLPEQREVAQPKDLISGPGLGLKRRPSHHSSEDEEDEEEGTGTGTELRICMRPRKLFKAREEEEEVEVRDVEVCSVMSSRVMSSVWEAMEGDGDGEAPDFSASQYMSSVCHQFNNELQRKIQNRSRRMDYFAKQSLNTVQQHVSSVSMQIHQYRSQTLEKIRGVLREEIHSLEQDNSSLKEMEKELTTYWRKQSQGFHSYQDRENRRLQNLRGTFQKNVCHSLEFEEQIFTSEMCLMRKDLKSVQDKLFKEIQEEEMLSVRRGLQALFLPEGCGF